MFHIIQRAHDYAPDVAMAKRQASQQLKHVENTHAEFLKKLHKVYTHIPWLGSLVYTKATSNTTPALYDLIQMQCLISASQSVLYVLLQIMYNSLKLYADNLDTPVQVSWIQCVHVPMHTL